MNKAILYILFILMFSDTLFSQRIIFQSDLETIPLILPDSLPAGWRKMDADNNNPVYNWAVRDTNQYMGSGDTSVFKTRAHSGKRSIFISWLAGLGGNNLNDDWLWSDSIRVQTGDSILFWMLTGATPRIAPQFDSVQIYITSAQNPSSVITKLATIKSNDSAGIPKNNNVWTHHKFDLSAYNNQKIYVAWRYYIVINSYTALWVNIDDIFIGNRSANVITPISTEIPERFELKQNYPNPFNPVTKIRFDIPNSPLNFPPKEGNLRLVIYNSLGKEIETLVNERLKPGEYEVVWPGNKQYPSGVYYYRIISRDYSETKKMVLIK